MPAGGGRDAPLAVQAEQLKKSQARRAERRAAMERKVEEPWESTRRDGGMADGEAPRMRRTVVVTAVTRILSCYMMMDGLLET